MRADSQFPAARVISYFAENGIQLHCIHMQADRRAAIHALSIGVLTAPSLGIACVANPLRADIHFLGPAFPAAAHIAAQIEGCFTGRFRAAFKKTAQFKEETERAFAGPSSPFSAAVVSMGDFVKLLSHGLLDDLDDLVAPHLGRGAIEVPMLVKADGRVKALAFIQNAQCLYFRRDIFERLGLKRPATYMDLLECARVIRRQVPEVPYPLAMTFAKGWDLATEFSNLYVGFGGRFFQPGSSNPAFANPLGVKTVDLMRELSGYMTPSFLSSTSDDVMNLLQQGRAAMGVLWASRAARMDDPASSKVVGKMDFGPAPALFSGGPSAAHLWWDGIVFPRNNRQSREAAMELISLALRPESIRSGNDQAIWIHSAYRPTRFGMGVTAAARSGAPAWPPQPYFDYAHAEIGKALPEALVGAVNPLEALESAARRYTQVAREKGFAA